MRYLKYLALVAALMVPLAYSQAQVSVGVGIGVGPGVVVGPPPVCTYGYYDYYPYACAPYGYYGPDYFVDGVFIGVGPWYHWGHPAWFWNRGYVARGWDHDGWRDGHAWAGRNWNHDGYARGGAYNHVYGNEGFRSGARVQGGAVARAGGGFHSGDGFHGGSGFHGGGRR